MDKRIKAGDKCPFYEKLSGPNACNNAGENCIGSACYYFKDHHFETTCTCADEEGYESEVSNEQTAD